MTAPPRARLDSLAAQRAYALAGRATFTVVNTATGGRFTYQVRLDPQARKGRAKRAAP